MKLILEKIDYTDVKQGADLLFLLGAYALDPMGGGQPLTEYVKTHLLASLAKQENVFSLIVYADQQPAALVTCVMGFSTFYCKPLINIHDLAVLAEFRGLGLSQKLLSGVENIAKQQDCCKITLEVLEGNIVAQKAYQKYGFAGYELDPVMGKAVFWQKTLT
jgi:ribosomal protein S18 acetylase RimI-like enzyme